MTTPPPTPASPMRTRLHRLAVAASLCLAAAGCSILGDSRGEQSRTTLFAPEPRIQADPAWPAVTWQLALSPPMTNRMIDGFRIAVRPVPDELQVYRGATWAKTPADMLLDTLLHTLEDSGRLPAIGRQGTGFSADYKLVLDIRRFEADYAGGAAIPAATIEVNAKLIQVRDQAIVASRTFLQAEPATSPEIAQVVAAFSRALGQIGQALSGWTLTEGNAHRQAIPSSP